MVKILGQILLNAKTDTFRNSTRPKKQSVFLIINTDLKMFLGFFLSVERTILWHAGEQYYFTTNEKNSKATELVHQMHIPTD